MQQPRLLSQSESPLDQLYRERQIEEASISAAFYREYKQARIDLFEHLRAENPSTDPLLILAKTQKILDRVTFVWFCEDFQIVPALTLRRLLEAVKQDSFNPSETKIWDRVRGLFKAINDGHPAAGINKFNGGLFAADPELEALKIYDSVLEHIIALEKYDFASDLNVNILGHIFEQSISDLEAIKAGVGDQGYDPKQGKRKKDGIFYTPEYITRYLVEQAVGGGPPTSRQELFSDLKPYLEQHYAVYHGVADLYVYFFEKGLNLLNPGGRFGFIVSNKFLRAGYGRKLTQWLQTQYRIHEVIDFGDIQIFEGATTYPCLIAISKETPPASQKVRTLLVPHLAAGQNLSQTLAEIGSEIELSAEAESWVIADDQVKGLMAKVQQGSVTLGEYVQNQIYYGIKTGFNEAFVIDSATRQTLIAQDPKSAELIKPYLVGRDLSRYGYKQSDKWLIVIPDGFTNRQKGNDPPESWLSSNYPSVYRHFLSISELVKSGQFKIKGKGLFKREDQGDYWWELRPCAYYESFNSPKILYSEIATHGQFYVDKNNHYCDTTVYMLGSDSYFLLGILNSKLFTFLFSKVSSEIRGGFLRWKKQYMKDMPIPTASPKQQVESATLAEQNQALHQKMSETRSKALAFLARELGVGKISQKLEKLEALSWSDFAAELGKQKIKLSLIQKEEWQDWHTGKVQALADLRGQIAALDAAIDRLVYGLYGLSAAEIALVEDNLQQKS